MIRRPPRSTLFPTRRSSDLPVLTSRWRKRLEKELAFRHEFDRLDAAAWRSLLASRTRARSEEHTSELQSHSDLVCRLLLEKKKKRTQSSLNAPQILSRQPRL